MGSVGRKGWWTKAFPNCESTWLSTDTNGEEGDVDGGGGGGGGKGLGKSLRGKPGYKRAERAN